MRWAVIIFALGVSLYACGAKTVTVDAIPTRATLPEGVKYYTVPVEAEDWDELCVARRVTDDPYMGHSCIPMRDVRRWAHGRLKAN